MLTKNQIVDGLSNGTLVLTMCEFGDGARGVALFRADSNMPIERIALQPWHIDQEDDELQCAEKDTSWFYTVFGAGELSDQAREMLAGFCRVHEETIIAWCDGDETAKLPQWTQ